MLPRQTPEVLEYGPATPVRLQKLAQVQKWKNRESPSEPQRIRESSLAIERARSPSPGHRLDLATMLSLNRTQIYTDHRLYHAARFGAFQEFAVELRIGQGERNVRERAVGFAHR